MTRTFCLALVVMTLLAGAALPQAQTLPAGVTAGPAAQGINEYRLANGLVVLLFPEPSKPTVTVNVTYLVGARHGNYGETGMAHLLEHLVFKGTPRHPDIPAEMRAHGAQYNAGTGMDYTNYFQTFAANSENLRWALELEADRMVNSRIAKEDLDAEMTVVRNEFELGENQPFQVLIQRLRETAFTWLSSGKPAIGNRSDIEHVPVDNLRAFYRTYYQPDNAVLLVAGKFEAEHTLAWISEYFGHLPRPERALPRYWTVEPQQDGERSVIIRRSGNVRALAILYRTPPFRHPDNEGINGATSILGDGPSSRVHKALVETGKAVAAGAFAMSGEDSGAAIFYAILKPDASLESARDELILQVESFAGTAATQEEVERFQSQVSNRANRLLADPASLGVALSAPIAAGDWRLLFLRNERLRQLSAAAIRKAAGAYFRRDARNVGLFIPDTEPQRATIPTAPSAAELLADFKDQSPVAAGEAFDATPENIDRRTRRLTIGAIKVALLAKKTRGAQVRVALGLDWGDERTLFGKRPVANLTRQLLLRGTTRFDRRQLADERRRLEIVGDVYAFQTTRANLAAALRLAAHVLRDPTFPEAEFEQLKSEVSTSLESQLREPGPMAGDAIARRFNHYPPGDWRYQTTLAEAKALLDAIRVDDVRAYHRDFYGAGKGEIAIVGDFDESEAIAVVGEMFQGWRPGMPFQRVVSAHHDVAAATESIDTPDKANAVLTARMNVSLNRFDPDYPALYAAAAIIGGDQLDSRLARRLRQKDGLTYSVGASLRAPGFGDAGVFEVDGSMAPANLERFESALRAELASARNEGLTAEEVARFKAGALQEFEQRRSSDGYLSARWRDLLERGKSFVEDREFEDALRGLTPASINDALTRRLDFNRLTVIKAGDLKKMLN